MTITFGWWLVPALITAGSFTWAIPMREDERPTGSMFSGMGYAIGGSLRIMAAAVASLAAWLVWSLAT